jgi:hypothetical protein
METSSLTRMDDFLSYVQSHWTFDSFLWNKLNIFVWTYMPYCVVLLCHMLQYDISAVLQTGCMFWNIFIFCTGFLLFTLSFRLVLWCIYNVVDPSSVFSYHSH